MKINRIGNSDPALNGVQMAKKKEKPGKPKTDQVDLSPQALAKLGMPTASASSRKADPQATGSQPTQLSDTYSTARKGIDTPLRSEKIEHARLMIQNRGYDSPEVVEAIVERLVSALKG